MSVPPDILAQMLSAGGGGGAPGGGPMDPTQGDPTMPAQPMMGDPNAASPDDQAVWRAFPSTDPTVVEQFATSGQGGSPVDLAQTLAQVMEMFSRDEDELHQRQHAALQHLLSQAATPPPDMAAMQPGPGVGGARVGR